VIGLGVVSYFGFPLPKDWAGTLDWLTDIDVWIINHVAYPSLFAFATALLFSTVVVPDVWAYIKRSTLQPAPDLALDQCVTLLLGTSSWVTDTPGQADRLLDLLGAIPQEAALGHVTIWGRREMGSGFSLLDIRENLQPIPSDYWTSRA
jgi:hypothetical protein